MNPNALAVISTIVCFLFSDNANAEDIHHPENTGIVGIVTQHAACFNNDGAIALTAECNGSAADEGFVSVNYSAGWVGGSLSHINGCGVDAVDPVSSATCPNTYSDTFAICTNNEYVLVQTTKSGHFWAVKANYDCGLIAELVPCLSTDAFEHDNGCIPKQDNLSMITVKGGYIQLETTVLTPAATHCAAAAHEGRMIVDTVNDLLYICTQSGWIAK